jgi:tetratricopeptide (TPR) repeat protein
VNTNHEPVDTSTRDVYIIYAHKDREWVDRLVVALRDLQITLWHDAADLAPSDSISGGMSSGLHKSRAAVIILSEASYASEPCHNELGVMIQRRWKNKSRIFPVALGISIEDAGNRERWQLISEVFMLAASEDIPIIAQTIAEKYLATRRSDSQLDSSQADTARPESSTPADHGTGNVPFGKMADQSTPSFASPEITQQASPGNTFIGARSKRNRTFSKRRLLTVGIVSVALLTVAVSFLLPSPLHRFVAAMETYRYERAHELLDAADSYAMKRGETIQYTYFLERGKLHAAYSEFDLAQQMLKKAARMRPIDPKPRNELGDVLASFGKTDEAIAEYDYVAGMTDPASSTNYSSFVDANIGLASIYRQRGKRDLAFRCIDEAKRGFSKMSISDWSQRAALDGAEASALLDFATLLEPDPRKRQQEQALAILEQSCTLLEHANHDTTNEYARLLHVRATALADLGRSAEAKQMLGTVETAVIPHMDVYNPELVSTTYMMQANLESDPFSGKSKAEQAWKVAKLGLPTKNRYRLIVWLQCADYLFTTKDERAKTVFSECVAAYREVFAGEQLYLDALKSVELKAAK